MCADTPNEEIAGDGEHSHRLTEIGWRPLILGPLRTPVGTFPTNTGQRDPIYRDTPTRLLWANISAGLVPVKVCLNIVGMGQERCSPACPSPRLGVTSTCYRRRYGAVPCHLSYQQDLRTRAIDARP